MQRIPIDQYMFQEIKLFMNFYSIGTNLKTSVSLSVYHTNFVYRCQEAIKMGVHATKGGFPINCCNKFTLLSRDFYV